MIRNRNTIEKRRRSHEGTCVEKRHITHIVFSGWETETSHGRDTCGTSFLETNLRLKLCCVRLPECSEQSVDTPLSAELGNLKLVTNDSVTVTTVLDHSNCYCYATEISARHKVKRIDALNSRLRTLIYCFH